MNQVKRPEGKKPNSKNHIQLTCMVKADAYDRIKSDSESSGLPMGMVVSKAILGVDNFGKN